MADVNDLVDQLYQRAGIEPSTPAQDVADQIWERAMAPAAPRMRPLAAPVQLAPAAPAVQQPQPPGKPVPTFGADDEVVEPPKAASFGQGDEIVKPAPTQAKGLPARSALSVPIKPATWDQALANPAPTVAGPVPPAQSPMPTNIDPMTGNPILAGPEDMAQVPSAVATPARGITDLGIAAAKGAGQGFGDQPLGMSPENAAKFPLTYRMWQPVLAPADFALRAPGALIGALSTAGAEAYKQMGGSEAWGNRLERDLNILGQGAMIESGMGGHHNVGKPKAVEGPPLSVEAFLARVDAADSPMVADFQRRALIVGGMDEATVNAMSPADRQAAYRDFIDKGGFGPSATAPRPAEPSAPQGETLALPGPVKGEGEPVKSAPESVKSQPESAKSPPEQPPASPPPEGEGKPASAPAPFDDGTAILKRYGYSDEQIADMSPKARAAEIAEAKAAMPSAAEIGEARARLGIDEPVKAAETPAPSNEAQKSVAGDNKLPAPESGHVAPTFGENDPIAGTRDASVPIETATDLSHATKASDTTYSPAQGEANNRQLGHAKWQGLKLSIETPAGGIRRGVDARSGQPWETTMGAAYGYIKGTKGADGMHLDVFVGDHPQSGTVYVINEVDRDTGKFRQTKSLVGFPSEQAAIEAYTGTSSKSAQTIGDIAAIPVDEFKGWIRRGDTTKPFPIEHTNVRARAPARPTQTMSLLQMIAYHGGLKPDADIRALGMSSKNRIPIPGVGFRSVLRGNGMTMDELAERMVEHGFLPEASANREADSGLHNRIREMIDQDLRGQRVMPLSEQGAGTPRSQEIAEEQNAARAEEIAAHKATIEASLKETGVPLDAVHPRAVEMAAELMADHGLQPDDALERAAMSLVDEEGLAEYAKADDIYGKDWTDALLPESAHAGGEEPAPGVDREVSPAENEAHPGGQHLEGGRAHEADAAEGAHATEGAGAQEAAHAEDRGGTLPVAADRGGAAHGAQELTFGHGDEIVQDKTDTILADHDYRLIDESTEHGRRTYIVEGDTDKASLSAISRALKLDGWVADGLRAFSRGKEVIEIEPGGEGVAEHYLHRISDKDALPADETASEPHANLPAKPMTIEVSGKRYPINSLKDASEMVTQARDTAAIGGSEFSAPKIFDENGKQIAHVSYNGRVWPGESRDWKPGDEPLYDNGTGLSNSRKTIEATPAGEQHVLPGAEKIGQGEQAQRKSDEALKPKVAQKPPDEGMFGDESQQTDLVDMAKKQPEPRPEGGASALTLADRFAERLRAGDGFPNILQARKLAREAGFGDDAKKVEEALELGVVKTAREIVANAEPAEAFKQLVDLYQRQPRLGTRTSTSMREQAFSTPAPLAYLASRLARVTPKDTVLEPTAGNGALLMEVAPKKAVVNEINPERRANLESQGFKVSARNALDKLVPDQSVDVILANPPFGVVKNDKGQSQTFDMGQIQPNYRTNEIDHAIVLNSLAAMHGKGGRAVLIIGGPAKTAVSEEARSDAYNTKAKRQFFKVLYDRYNVVDHFGVAGELYERQGAGWPVDVIVIDGAGKSALKLPAVDVPRMYRSWDELGGLIDGRARDAGSALGADDDAARPVAEPGRGDGVGAVDAGGSGSVGGRSGPLEPEGVQPGPVRGDTGAVHPDREGGEAGLQSGERGEPGGTGAQPDAERRPHGLDDFDKAFDAALDETFGPQAGPKSSQGGVPEGYEVDPATRLGSEQESRLKGGQYKAVARRLNPWSVVEGYGDTPLSAQNNALKRLKLPDRLSEAAPPKRTTKQVLKETVASGAESADAAMAGLVELFGGGKTHGSGPAFDEATYAKAKPLFVRAAEKFKEFAGNVAELIRRMVAEMQRVHGLTRDALERMRPHMRRFMDEVSQGIVKLGEQPVKAEPRAKPEFTKATATEQATDSQTPYVPRSQSPGLGTLVPVNMRSSIEQSLAGLEKRVGNLDDYVAKELGYSPDDLGRYFGAEQVDALALAIDNLRRGKGFIIGDQTGIGKGRVNAGIIRWAIANDHIPIFVTEKPNLYGDMYRDLTDVGIQEYLGREPKMVMTNSGETVPLDEEGKMKLRSGSAEEHKSLLNGITADSFGKHYDVAFTTYNQMQTVKENETARRAFLKRIAPNAVLIFDESHNAGGQKVQGRSSKDEEAQVKGRAGFARELIRASGRVFYSSATYAKRPDVMDLYSATDMAMAVANPTQLGEAIAKGGVPMQQAVAAMLAEAGQYIRRERSFAGIKYDTPVVSVDKPRYDGIAHSLAAIQDLSKIVKAVTKNVSKDLKAEAGGAGTMGGTGDAGASSVNFTATMHNLVNQMLLGMKVQPAAEAAIEALKNGQKPVLTVANTMESFLNDYASEMGIEHGGVIEADFSRVLHRYLEKTRTISIRKPFMKKGEKAEKRYLTDEQLGSAGRAAYNRAKDLIDSLDLTDLPLSPIDAIKDRIRKAGYSVGEITGRGSIVDYSETEPRLRSRGASELSIRGRRDTISKYNGGALDAMVINQAGATGLSLHASERFKDQRQRKMIIVQPEGNVDTHMQMLGRVNRTGQVVKPEYAQLIADVPAEKRPAAVLAKKMASLNANTTGARGGALTAKDVPDFINQYGDAVAHAYMSENPDINARLAMPLKPSENGGLEHEDAMRKVTGRIPLLPLKMQEEVYAHLESEYAALLQQKDAAGENALEAKHLDLKARTLEKTEVVPPKPGSSSPFAAPVTMEKVSASRLGKPYTSNEVVERALTELGVGDRLADVTGNRVAEFLAELESNNSPLGKVANRRQHEQQKAVLPSFEVYKRSITDELEDPKKAESERNRLDAVKDRWKAINSMTSIGARVTLRTSNGNLSGVVIKNEQKGAPKNPLALSTWKVTVAIPDASRQITLPYSRLWERNKSDTDSDMAIEIEPTPAWIESPQQTADRFDHLQGEVKEDRYIATGNLLAAYEYLNKKGQIVHFTDSSGAVRQGVLTARDFKFDQFAKNKGTLLRSPAEIRDQIKKSGHVTSADGNIEIQSGNPGQYAIRVASAKRVGGRYFLDRALTDLVGDFRTSSGKMAAVASDSNILSAIERLQSLGAQFSGTAGAKLNTVKVEEGETAQRTSHLTARAADQSRELARDVKQAINQVAGWDPAVRAEVVERIEGELHPDWGKAQRGAIIAGQYNYAKDLITVATANGTDAVRTAYHEGWHAIESVLTDQERMTLHREVPRLRDQIARYGDIDRETVDQITEREVFAEAAATYTRLRSEGQHMSGIHIAVRRILEKLYELFARIKNALNGRGFTAAEDIFKDFSQGEMARRRERASVRPSEDEIAQSITVPRPVRDLRDAIADRIAPTLNKANEGIYDLTAPTKALRDEVGARQGGALPDSQDFHTKKRLHPGRVGVETEEFNKRFLDPMAKEMKAAGISLPDGALYLYAKHAIERNLYISRINPDLPDGGSGMTSEQAAETIDRYESGPNGAAYRQLAQRASDIRQFTLQAMQRYGLETPATIKAWREQYGHYVPLKGWEDAPKDAPPNYRHAAQFNIRGREVQPAFGRRSRADNALVNLLEQAYRTIDRGETNRYLQSMHLALRGLGPEGTDIATMNKGQPRRVLDRTTGLVRTQDTAPHVGAPETVSLKIGGNPVHWVYKNVEQAEAIKRMRPDQLEHFQWAVNLQNKLKALWTHYSPDFLFRHFMFRYPIEGTLNSIEQREQGANYKASRYISEGFPFLGTASKAIFASNKGATSSNIEVARMQQYWQEMRQHGGAMVFRNMRDTDTLRDHLTLILRDLNGRPDLGLREQHRKAIEAMDTVTNTLDNALRLAAFAAARRNGLTPQQAALAAREATVDFQLKGRWANKMALYAPFVSVANATAARMVKAIGRSKTMRRVFAGTMLAGFMLGMYNYLMGGDDKDGVAYFDKVSEWDKRLNFIFFVPGVKDAKGRPQPFKIPMPYNWALPLTMGYAFSGMIFSKEKNKVGKNLKLTFEAALESLTPLGSEHDKLAYAVPELARPIYHVATNEKFSGSPVHIPADMANSRFGKNRQTAPNAYTSWQRPTAEQQVGGGYENIARFMNNVTGGSSTKSGALDLYPEDVKEILGYGIGTQMRFGQNVYNSAAAIAKGEAPRPSSIPLSRVIYGTDYDAADRARAFERGREARKPWLNH